MQTMHVRIILVLIFFGLLGGIIYVKSRQAGKSDTRQVPQTVPVKVNAAAPTSAPRPALPALLDFGRGKCVVCKEMKPFLEELQKELAGKVEVRIVDIGERPEEAEKYNIKLIPTQLFLDASGKEVFCNEGFMSKADILAKLKQMGVN